MTIFTSAAKRINIIINLLIFSQAIPLCGQDSFEFAEYLFNQKDYFRAISIYKRLLFECREKTCTYEYSTHIAKAYQLSGKFKSSIYFYSESIKNATSVEEKSKSLIGLGLNYYHLKTLPMAKNYFRKAAEIDTTGKAELLLGLIEMEKMNWSHAQTIFKNIQNTYSNTEVTKTAYLLKQKVEEGINLPQKNPLFATVLSTILPGSGQIYSGHFFDGVQAMAYVGAFSLATYSAYRYDRDVRDSDAFLFLSASITAVFYFSNILGAHKTAEFRNIRIRQNFMSEVQKIVFEVPF